MPIVRRSDRDRWHGLESVLRGRQGRGSGPEEDQVLLFDGRHFFHDGPQPSFDGYESIRAFSGLVVERGVANEGLHVDITNLK